MLFHKGLLFSLILVASQLVTIPSALAVTESKEKDIGTLMELLGVSSMAQEMADMMVTIVITKEKERNPRLPKKAEYIISQAVHDVLLQHANELFKMTAPLYDKYYTHSEVKDLIRFFSSPTGKKYSAVAIPMMKDMIPIAQKWAGHYAPETARRVEKELKRHGYE